MKRINPFSQQLINANDEMLTVEQVADMFKIKPDGTVLKGTYRPSLSNLSDDNILGKKFYENSELPNVLKGRKATYNSIKSMTLALTRNGTSQV